MAGVRLPAIVVTVVALAVGVGALSESKMDAEMGVEGKYCKTNKGCNSPYGICAAVRCWCCLRRNRVGEPAPGQRRLGRSRELVWPIQSSLQMIVCLLSLCCIADACFHMVIECCLPTSTPPPGRSGGQKSMLLPGTMDRVPLQSADDDERLRGHDAARRRRGFLCRRSGVGPGAGFGGAVRLHEEVGERRVTPRAAPGRHYGRRRVGALGRHPRPTEEEEDGERRTQGTVRCKREPVKKTRPLKGARHRQASADKPYYGLSRKKRHKANIMCVCVCVCWFYGGLWWIVVVAVAVVL